MSQQDKKQIGQSVEEQAAFWRINRRTLLNWRDDGAPLGDYDGMVEWASKRDPSKLPKGFVAKLRDDGVEGGGMLGMSDPDWDEFEEQMRNEDPKVGMERIEKACAWVSFKFQKASQANDRKLETHYAKLVATLESVKHDALLRAKKLGIDSGELLKREDVEKWAHSLGFWLLRGADAALADVTPKLVSAAAHGKLDRDAALQILEPAFISSIVVGPLQRSTTTNAANAVPDMLAESITAGLQSVVE